MAILSRGRLRNDYILMGEFALRFVTILLSEDSDFVFLSEDDNDILISERPEGFGGRLRGSYRIGGSLVEQDKNTGRIKDSYKIEGMYEREEL